MRKALFLIMMILIALTMMACDEDGELRIRNRTNSHAWVRVNDADIRQIEGWTNWSKYYSGDATVNIDYWGNFVFTKSVTREVYRGLVTTVDILPDGGAIKLINDGQTTITEVYISPNAETTWGDDQLAENLAPNANFLWTLTPGQWDIKVVDEENTNYYKINQTVVLDQTLDLPITGFGKSAVPGKSNGAASSDLTWRVERK